MKYQLVIQLPEESYGNIEWIAKIEDILDKNLIDAEVDGHDIGSGEVNIFINTNVPTDTFEAIKIVLQNDSVLEDAKIAYREINSESYFCLWPNDLTTFKVV